MRPLEREIIKGGFHSSTTLPLSPVHSAQAFTTNNGTSMSLTDTLEADAAAFA